MKLVQVINGEIAQYSLPKKGTLKNFEGKVYESLIDSNTWSPIAYPARWKLYVA